MISVKPKTVLILNTARQSIRETMKKAGITEVEVPIFDNQTFKPFLDDTAVKTITGKRPKHKVKATKINAASSPAKRIDTQA